MSFVKIYLAEARHLWRLTWPVFLAQISQVGMAFTDTVMTGHHSSADMAAVALAVSIWHPVSLFGLGCLLAISPLTAQMVGAGNSQDSPRLFRQGILVAFMLCVPLMLFLQWVSHQLGAFGVEPRLADLGGGFLRCILWGLPGLFLFIVARGIVEGHARTRPAMVIGIVGLIALVPLNYIFIYGKFGVPAFGAIGCGIVTAAIFWLMAICMIWYVLHSAEFKKLRPLFSPMRLDMAVIKRILQIGLPGALAIVFEVSLFALTAILLAPFGTTTVAGHQVAINFSGLLFMVPMSLGITSTIRVGQKLGAGDQRAAQRAARTALTIGLIAACINAVWVIALRREIVLMYNDEIEVVALASNLLVFAAAFQFIDALQCISIGILRGYNDTKMISGMCFAAYFLVGLPLGFALARTGFVGGPHGAYGFWASYVVALSVVCFFLIWRIRYLHGMDMEKIKSVFLR